MKKPFENLEKRKVTGGRRRTSRGRRKYEKDGYPAEPVVGPHRVEKKRIRGGGYKIVLRGGEHANVTDKATGETKKARILRVLRNRADRDYERRGVLTKGAVIETEAGAAIITSRPSQDGVVNAVLVEGRQART